MRANVANGDLRALALCATSYFTARSVSFFEAETTVSEWSRAQRHGERVPLSLDYLMASLGIPFLFPPTCLQGEFFGDGAMRQTAPLSPAIHLGADRLLVVGVRPTHLDADPAFHRLRLTADARAAVRLHAGYAVQRPDLRRPREPRAASTASRRWPAAPPARARSSTMMIAPSLDPSELAVRFVGTLPVACAR